MMAMTILCLDILPGIQIGKNAVKADFKMCNRHGTRCAGEVAATADNGVCVPGIAFNAKIGGLFRKEF